MANRKIKIIYTKESGRHPFYTTEANLDNQDRHFRKIIKEVVLVDEVKGKNKIALPEPKQEVKHKPLTISEMIETDVELPPLKIGKNTEVIETVKEITKDDVVEQLIKMGKTREEAMDFVYPKPVIKVEKETKKRKVAKKV